MDSMYDVLLQLPIFQGVSRNKISELIEKMKFHFLKYPDGEKIVTCGEECNHLKFLISGEIRSELVTQNEKMKISEKILAPNVIAPEHLFGRDTYFPANLYAVGTVGIMQIEKASVVQMLQEEPIFLINLLNILSRRSQKALESFTSFSSSDLKERLAFWILSLTQQKSTDIHVICKQKDLYSFFGVQRSVFLSTLDRLKEEGIIDYDTKEIVVLDRSRLKDLLLSSSQEDF
ncbi:Crp/Fnr family transcriptional regulator [Barnesiella sp. An55]|uniref:Crp/Fnr family transcriptional regulator n=1 Tax=Barnesiella sp. An55 TaxID=1965646 RepID=UPI000B385620|nr:Crp/Fnr family transcriptional regulator [Barnesiella sp. An55]OUN73393.1 hypothetical protein B5G10_04415 [Barnesiella sp. An55]HIZ25941.1 Crp/Fnr family transcriptional regulator [Candidatus Barnesiella merdipullorum]